MLETKSVFQQLTTKYSTLSVEDLQSLIMAFEGKISQSIGIPINPISYTQIEKKFSGDSLIIDNIPIKEIHSLNIDGKCIHSCNYILDKDSGIIYFKNHYSGFLELKYISCVDDNLFDLYIQPLLLDMIEYHFDTAWNKDASSIKEGDVQINFDTSIGKGALIQKNLDELKNLFSAYCRMI